MSERRSETNVLRALSKELVGRFKAVVVGTLVEGAIVTDVGVLPASEFEVVVLLFGAEEDISYRRRCCAHSLIVPMDVTKAIVSELVADGQAVPFRLSTAQLKF